MALGIFRIGLGTLWVWHRFQQPIFANFRPPLRYAQNSHATFTCHARLRVKLLEGFVWCFCYFWLEFSREYFLHGLRCRGLAYRYEARLMPRPVPRLGYTYLSGILRRIRQVPTARLKVWFPIPSLVGPICTISARF